MGSVRKCGAGMLVGGALLCPLQFVRIVCQRLRTEDQAPPRGQTHGRFGLDEMVRVKYLDIDRMPGMKKLWWHGYGESFGRQMEGFLDMQFARGMGTRVRGALRAAGILRRKQL